MKWIVDLYDLLCVEKQKIISVYSAAGITEPNNDARSVTERIENSFRED